MASRTGNDRWRPTVFTTEARRITDTAIAKAESAAAPVSVAVVDESGVLKEFTWMDGAALVSVQTAMSKAYAAAAIGMPADEFYSAIESDGAAVASFATRPGLALIAGGLPLVVDGQVAGAIGVAGAMTGAEDRRIVEAAVNQTGHRRGCPSAINTTAAGGPTRPEWHRASPVDSRSSCSIRVQVPPGPAASYPHDRSYRRR